jgi:DNA-binding response OmpR family regulator
MASANTASRFLTAFRQASGHNQGNNAGGSARVLETGDFRIDLSTRAVTVRGQQVELTVPEFDLLLFLTTHAKKLVTPRTMLSTKLDGHGVRQTEFLRVLLTLRQKLDAVGAKHYIRTEPWICYLFEPSGS